MPTVANAATSAWGSTSSTVAYGSSFYAYGRIVTGAGATHQIQQRITNVDNHKVYARVTTQTRAGSNGVIQNGSTSDTAKTNSASYTQKNVKHTLLGQSSQARSKYHVRGDIPNRLDITGFNAFTAFVNY